MTLDGGHAMLASALKNLQARWEDISVHWQDETRKQFVVQLWEPLLDGTEKVLKVIDQLQVLLNQMRRECEGTRVDLHSGE